MQRTTLLIPLALKRRAEQRARALGVSFGQLLRNALEAALQDAKTGHAIDPLFEDDTVFRDSTPTDLAVEHDRYLYGKP